MTAHAVRDVRTPWHVRAFGWFIVAYALSPIDLIPDFVPVLGLLDDLLLLPAGLLLLRRLIPEGILQDYQFKRNELAGFPMSLTGAVMVIGLWVAALIIIGAYVW